ncbi:MAG: hypothetical protein ICV64_02720 [Thermoleophilia bacterium]|nr:hypothetical protein [Thermoleophilia bacterium]
MEAERALAELLEVNPEVEAATILDGDEIVASTLSGERAEAFARAVRDVVTVAERVKPGQRAPLVRLEASLDGAALFVRRAGERTAAAITARAATAPLVLHDLSGLLRRVRAQRGAEVSDATA